MYSSDGGGASNNATRRLSEGTGTDETGRYYGSRSIEALVAAILCFVFVVALFLLLRLYLNYVRRRQARRRWAAVALFHTGIASQDRQTQTPVPTPPKVGLEPAVIAALPRLPYRTVAANAPHGTPPLPTPPDCAVCLSTVEEGEMVRVMPNCNHTFHEQCIDMWLHSHTTCPICRTEAAPATTVVVQETSEICDSAAVERSGSCRDQESSTSSAGGLGASLRWMLSRGTSSRRHDDVVDDTERR